MWDEVSDLVARLLTRFPVLSIVGSLFSIALLSTGLINVHFEHDIRKSFSPVDSKTSLETETFLEFYNLSVFPQRAFCIFQSKDGGDILREPHVKEILRFDKQLTDVLLEEDEHGQASCHPMCGLNRPFHAFLKEKNSLSTEVSFPVSKISSMPIFLGMHMRVVNETSKSSGTFSSQSLMTDRIVLWYFSRADTDVRRKNYQKITRSFFELSKTDNFSSLINFTIFGDEVANKEMVRGALEATYLMSIGFILLLVFVVAVVWQQSPPKMVPLLVTATILTPFLATIAAFGVLAWVGYPIYSMQCVTPFLVLGIGVDDAFILMHRWRARSSIQDRVTRLRRVIVDVGPSITITSITNIIAFGVGFFTPTPQMSLFCLATSVALLLDYIFTYTILAPVVFLCVEDEQYRSIAEKKKEAEYTEFLTSTKGRLACLVLLISLYTFCSIGVFTMKSTFEPAKGFPASSPLMSSLAGIRPVFDTYFPVNIYVNSPPDISDDVDYPEFLKMVSELESIPGAYGRDRTLLFLTPYVEFDKKIWSMTQILHGETEFVPSIHNLGYWLDRIGMPPNVHYIKPKNSSEDGELKSFGFSLLGKGMAEWANRADFVSSVRKVLGDHPEFNATLFDVDSPVLSLILTVRNDLIGSIAVTVGCMALVCLLFVASRVGVLIITFTITSICYCLVGCLGWWGADLDPVTQVDVLLATGFSVDYTAHVAYQFYRSRGSPNERLFKSLDEMAAPMVQAGLSTFLCMLPLILVPTYAIVAFAKTVFIVVSVGLVHGLFVLPVLVTTFCPKYKAEPLSAKEMVPLGIEDLPDRNGNSEMAE